MVPAHTDIPQPCRRAYLLLTANATDVSSLACLPRAISSLSVGTQVNIRRFRTYYQRSRHRNIPLSSKPTAPANQPASIHRNRHHTTHLSPGARSRHPRRNHQTQQASRSRIITRMRTKTMCLEQAVHHEGCGCPRNQRTIFLCSAARKRFRDNVHPAQCPWPRVADADQHNRVCDHCTRRLRSLFKTELDHCNGGRPRR